MGWTRVAIVPARKPRPKDLPDGDHEPACARKKILDSHAVEEMECGWRFPRFAHVRVRRRYFSRIALAASVVSPTGCGGFSLPFFLGSLTAGSSLVSGGGIIS